MNTSEMALYVGGYAPADQAGIHACTFDDATSELTVRDSFTGIVNPSYVLVHPNGCWLYTVSETSQQQASTSGAVWALNCTREPCAIEPINHQASGGDWQESSARRQHSSRTCLLEQAQHVRLEWLHHCDAFVMLCSIIVIQM